MLHNYKSI